MNKAKTSNAILFWKIYCIIMAADLLLYVAIFYVGRLIPPANAYTSFPGNWGLCICWLLAHFPTERICSRLPDEWLWLLVLQDVWLAALIYGCACLWRMRKDNAA